jgi:hypothetical protein
MFLLRFCKIHVDRYKGENYQLCADPFLQRIISRSQDLRFHACDRYNRCSAIEDSKGAVYVNPVEMSTDAWRMYKLETTQHLVDGKRINNLVSLASM